MAAQERHAALDKLLTRIDATLAEYDAAVASGEDPDVLDLQVVAGGQRPGPAALEGEH